MVKKSKMDREDEKERKMDKIILGATLGICLFFVISCSDINYSENIEVVEDVKVVKEVKEKKQDSNDKLNEYSRATQETNQKQSQLAKEKLVEYEAKAKKLIAEEKYGEAAAVYEKYYNNFSSPDTAERIRDEIFKLRKSESAAETYQRCKYAAESWVDMGEYNEALKNIDIFLQECQDTYNAEKILEYKKEIEKLKSKADVLAKQEEQMPFQNLLSEEFSRSWRENGRCWSEQNGIILCDNTESWTSTRAIGEDDWKDYIIEIEFEIVKGGFDLGIRGIPSGREGIRNYQLVDIANEVWSSGAYHVVRVEVRKDKVEISSSDMKEKRFIRLEDKYAHGPIALFVREGSSAKFREIKIKHLEKVNPVLIELAD
ncbi:MAG: hypothetical protein ABIH42_09590 [Planctomycetota bacterium]